MTNYNRGVDDPWYPCILTLDGGGIRGYSSLLILKALMHEISEWEAYYDNNKTVDIRSDSPTSHFSGEEQAAAGAARGRPGKFVVETTDHHPDHPQHRVTTDVPLTQTIPASDFAGGLDESTRDALCDDLSQAAPKTQATSGRHADLFPCHYFDFMYGTSTGGIIATTLGRLRMTVPEALELYRKVGDDLFGIRRSRVPLRTKYYHEPLEKAVREIVKSRCKDHEDCDGK